MLLEVKSLTVHYEQVEALKNVSINVDAGKIVALIGSNGAGKSTLIKSIMGLQNPTSGEIWYDGQLINRNPTHRRAKLGIRLVPEGRRLFPDMTVMDNLLCGAYLEHDRKKIMNQLENVFLHFPILRERSGQSAGSLSGGQQQMVTFGRAIMGNAKLLLMDEPTLGLSPILCQEVRDIIKSIHDSGLTVLLSEQNARIALQLAQTAYVLQNGIIEMSGESRELVNNPMVKRIYFGG